MLTTSRGKAYKPLTDEDGGASGAGGRLRSGVSHETADIVGVIAGRRLSRRLIFDWVFATWSVL